MEKPPLNISNPGRLALKEFDFRIVENDGSKLIALDKAGFQSYLHNQKMIENRVIELQVIVNKYKQYYE